MRKLFNFFRGRQKKVFNTYTVEITSDSYADLLLKVKLYHRDVIAATGGDYEVLESLMISDGFSKQSYYFAVIKEL